MGESLPTSWHLHSLVNYNFHLRSAWQIVNAFLLCLSESRQATTQMQTPKQPGFACKHNLRPVFINWGRQPCSCRKHISLEPVLVSGNVLVMCLAKSAQLKFCRSCTSEVLPLTYIANPDSSSCKKANITSHLAAPLCINEACSLADNYAPPNGKWQCSHSFTLTAAS